VQRIALPRGVRGYEPAKPLGTPVAFGTGYKGSSNQYGDFAIKRLNFCAKDAVQREVRLATGLAGRNSEV
jgi:hypothetical protein